jgi:hypothetical protein
MHCHIVLAHSSLADYDFKALAFSLLYSSNGGGGDSPSSCWLLADNSASEKYNIAPCYFL